MRIHNKTYKLQYTFVLPPRPGWRKIWWWSDGV